VRRKDWGFWLEVNIRVRVLMRRGAIDASPIIKRVLMGVEGKVRDGIRGCGLGFLGDATSSSTIAITEDVSNGFHQSEGFLRTS
jgi:hypothetical protein